jgi:phosphopantothenoylcysteine synthetase/decarboxylase
MDKVDEVAALLSEAAEVHAMMYRITDGEDPDIASWYAKWLIELSEFPDILGGEPVRSHLIYELVRLEREYEDVETDEPWEMFYAAQLLDIFTVEDSDEEEDEEYDEDEDYEDDEGDEDEDESFDESDTITTAFEPSH